jgi:hypothetical protein
MAWQVLLDDGGDLVHGYKGGWVATDVSHAAGHAGAEHEASAPLGLTGRPAITSGLPGNASCKTMALGFDQPVALDGFDESDRVRDGVHRSSEGLLLTPRR